MIRRTRRLSPSWRALLMPSRTAAKIPDRRLRMVAARVTNGVRALRWALEQNRSSRNATSVSSSSEPNTARRASLSPYARHSWPAFAFVLAQGGGLLVGEVAGVLQQGPAGAFEPAGRVLVG